MSKYEKIAWFWLALFAVSVVLFCVLFLLLESKFDVLTSIRIAHSAFAIMAFCAFGPLIFKGKKSASGMTGEPGRKLVRFQYGLAGAIFIGVFIGVWAWTKTAGTPTDQATVLLVFMYVSMIALLALILYLYLKQQRVSKLAPDGRKAADVLIFGPDLDERDLEIQKTARWGAFGVFWGCYILFIMSVWGWARYRDYRSISMDIDMLPLFVFDAAILVIVLHSVISLILYRRGSNN
jgi:hypothetical protein